MASDDAKKPRQLGGELAIPILAVAFTLYYFGTIWNSPWTAQVSAFLIGGILLGVCALFALRCVLWWRAGEGSLGASNLVGADDLRSGRAALAIATVLYCAAIQSLGFTLTTFLFLLVGMAALSKFRNLGLVAALSALISLIGWAVFVLAFDTRFPRGWFETAMETVLGHG